MKSGTESVLRTAYSTANVLRAVLFYYNNNYEYG